MNAFVYRNDGDFSVLYTQDGSPCDHAGPFDEEHDAVMAARRAVGSDGLVDIAIHRHAALGLGDAE